MNDKPLIYNVLKPRDYKGKTYWQAIATAFTVKDGEGMRFELPDGVSISGTVLIMPKTEREAAADQAPPVGEDGIPF